VTSSFSDFYQIVERHGSQRLVAQLSGSEPLGTPSEPQTFEAKRLTAFSLAPKTVILQACQKVRNPKNRDTEPPAGVASKSSEPQTFFPKRYTASLSAPNYPFSEPRRCFAPFGH